MSDTSNDPCGKVEPTEEHKWLQKLVGEWTSEMVGDMGPDQPPMKSEGTESVRAMGELWIVADGTGETPTGEQAAMMLTLGYDPEKKRFVGSWVGSMMTHMWVYEGELDASRKVLTLNSEGPSNEGPGKTAKYQDIIDWQDDDYRLLRSRMLNDKGEWVEFMVAHYRRKK